MLKIKKETEFRKTEIGEVPRNWEVKRLKEVALISTGGTPSRRKKEYWNGNINWLKSKEVQDNYIYDTEEKITEEGREKSNAKKIYPAGTLILAIYASPTAGRVAILKTSSTINQALAAIEGANTKFLFFSLIGNRERLLLNASGVAQQNLNLSIVKNFKIPYPPPSEQSRIATVLSWFDDLIENKKRQNEILEKTAMAIFKSWFVDFEPFKNEEFVYSEELEKEIPKGWEVKTISNVANVLLGGTPKRELPEYWNGDIKWATAKDVANTNGIYILETEEKITKRGLEKSNAKLLYTNTVLITARGTVGEVRLLGEPMACNQTCYGLISNDNMSYCYLFLSLRNVIAQIKAVSYGTVFETITMKNFDEIKVPIPPLPILQRFHSLVEPLFQKIILNQKQIMLLRKTRAALLPKLVFGKLRVVET